MIKPLIKAECIPPQIKSRITTKNVIIKNTDLVVNLLINLCSNLKCTNGRNNKISSPKNLKLANASAKKVPAKLCRPKYPGIYHSTICEPNPIGFSFHISLGIKNKKEAT